MFHCQNASLQTEGGSINDLENIDKWKGIFIASLKKVSLKKIFIFRKRFGRYDSCYDLACLFCESKNGQNVENPRK